MRYAKQKLPLQRNNLQKIADEIHIFRLAALGQNKGQPTANDKC